MADFDRGAASAAPDEALAKARTGAIAIRRIQEKPSQTLSRGRVAALLKADEEGAAVHRRGL